MAKRTKVTETVNGKETFLAKKERGAKGHFVKGKPEPVAKKAAAKVKLAAPPIAVQKTQHPLKKIDMIDVSTIQYKTVKNSTTGKTFTVGSINESHKPLKWGNVEKIKLWRYNKNNIDLFRLSVDPPSSESNNCEMLVTFYDVKRDVLALKRAIAQHEKEIELTA